MKQYNSKIERYREKFLRGIGNPEISAFIPDEFQKAAIASIEKGQDTLVVAPTGSGKTHIALQGIRKFLESGKKAIYTAPLKALSNTKYIEFKNIFEPDFKVGLLTGDRKIEPDADVVIATTEIFRNDLFSDSCEYSFVVLDELHYIADPFRGPVWEESIILSPTDCTLLMLSASISNPDEIASWIEDVRSKPVSVIVKETRSVELRLGFLHPKFGAIPLEDNNGELMREISSWYDEDQNSRNRSGRSDRRYDRSPNRNSDRNRRGRK